MMRVNLGKAISWTDKELDALSEVTIEDIESAAKWWRQYSPPEYENLLDATKEVIASNSKRKSKSNNA